MCVRLFLLIKLFITVFNSIWINLTRHYEDVLNINLLTCSMAWRLLVWCVALYYIVYFPTLNWFSCMTKVSIAACTTLQIYLCINKGLEWEAYGPLVDNCSRITWCGISPFFSSFILKAIQVTNFNQTYYKLSVGNGNSNEGQCMFPFRRVKKKGTEQFMSRSFCIEKFMVEFNLWDQGIWSTKTLIIPFSNWNPFVQTGA
jgi:hypothetical protein